PAVPPPVRLEPRAEPVAVVEPDRYDHGDIGRDQVRGIESAAETHLEHRDLDTPPGKDEERGERVVLEEGERGAAARGLDRLEGLDELGVSGFRALDADALAVAHEVPRSGQARAAAPGAKTRLRP